MKSLKKHLLFYICSIVALIDAIITVATLGFVLTSFASTLVDFLHSKKLLQIEQHSCNCGRCDE